MYCRACYACEEPVDAQILYPESFWPWLHAWTGPQLEADQTTNECGADLSRLLLLASQNGSAAQLILFQLELDQR